ncbi:hypothetical protein SAMN04488168_1507 [Bacillus sp. 491mf]|uniref:hypothetical protein n=1 Tax=Bacillus sp. 491mf TaxID=1761755 RepID=UPI0008EA5D88|nr:hypothetical protein [Bacillus sp. 491mf]SFD54584.1 hypothetical protein SAMN04488168_1507 [Bacillus sp. 491mf]
MSPEKQLSEQQHRKRRIMLIVLFLFLALGVLGVLSIYLFQSGDSSPEIIIQEKTILESVDEHSHP